MSIHYKSIAIAKKKISSECEESLQEFRSKGFEEEDAITKAAPHAAFTTSTWRTSKSIFKTDHLDERVQKDRKIMKTRKENRKIMKTRKAFIDEDYPQYPDEALSAACY